MRLLKVDSAGNFSLTKPFDSAPPPYAILSHTWGKDEYEITFDDLSTGQYKNKVGFAKLDFCAEQARADGLDHFWIDTCCIKKTDSAELSRSITSMFSWYRAAKRCYVYLPDVPELKRNHDGSMRTAERMGAFRNSRWFTRGWTLQELIAPQNVEFFSRDRKSLGTKQTLAAQINEITAIPVAALLGQTELTSFPPRERMSWMQGRRTTKPEDKIYALLGIFDVSMAVAPGESERHALDRLRSAIMARYRSHELENLGQFLDEKDFQMSRTESFVSTEPESSVEDRRKLVLDSLSFEQMDARRTTIKSEYRATCAWLLKHPTYQHWSDCSKLSEHHGLLWIRGKPGSGKSTLMKYAHARTVRAHAKDAFVVSFFFNARGEELEKTTVGMYRSLIFQLLQKAPDLLPSLDEYASATAIEWTQDQLCDLLVELLSRLEERRCILFVDALDECEEQQIRDMLHFFEDITETSLQNGARLNICFSSRHYPAIDTPIGLKMTLQDEQGHGEDLTRYIKSRLRAGTGDYIEDVRARVKEKAKGIFLWTVLVVDILNKEFEDGYLPAVEKRLNEIPIGLSELFRDILQRDNKKMDQFCLCLQWIMFSKRPLTKEEYYFAMLAGLDPHSTWDWNAEKVAPEYMERFVHSSSKGLAELTKSKPTVQFIHESVRDFLMTDGGFHEIWPNLPVERTALESTCHDRLKTCCEVYLGVHLGHILPPELLPAAKSAEIKVLREKVLARHPFLEYAEKHVLHHANEAAGVIPQALFLDYFARHRWIQLHDLFELHQINRYQDNRDGIVPMSYVLADGGYARLIDATSDFPGCIQYLSFDHGGRWRSPIVAALAKNSLECLRKLLPHAKVPDIRRSLACFKAGQKPSMSQGRRTLLEWAILRGDEGLSKALLTVSGPGLDHLISSTRDAVYLAVSNGLVEVALSLLEKGALPYRCFNTSSYKALSAASRGGYTDVVTQLLKAQPNPDEFERLSEDALSAAVHKGHTEIVRLLLAAGARLTHSAMLRTATSRGYAEIVKLLLSTKEGAEIAQNGPILDECLESASAAGHVEVVERLLWSGAKVEGKSGLESPLELASRHGHTHVVMLLIKEGADVDRILDDGETAIVSASRCGHAEVVALLLQSGASVEGNAWRSSPVNIALSNESHDGHIKVAKLLLDKIHSDLLTDSQDPSAYTVRRFHETFLAASAVGHSRLVELLLSSRKDDPIDEDVLAVALRAATREDHHEVVKLLKDYRSSSY